MEKMVISFMDGSLVNKPEIPSSCGGHDVNSLYDCGKGKQFYETLKKEALFFAAASRQADWQTDRHRQRSYCCCW